MSDEKIDSASRNDRAHEHGKADAEHHCLGPSIETGSLWLLVLPLSELSLLMAAYSCSYIRPLLNLQLLSAPRSRSSQPESSSVPRTQTQGATRLLLGLLHKVSCSAMRRTRRWPARGFRTCLSCLRHFLYRHGRLHAKDDGYLAGVHMAITHPLTHHKSRVAN